jgi:hypothetical protein
MLNVYVKIVFSEWGNWLPLWFHRTFSLQKRKQARAL